MEFRFLVFFITKKPITSAMSVLMQVVRADIVRAWRAKW
jgi:hypothetical protein